jgi:PAS domain-containing protein
MVVPPAVSDRPHKDGTVPNKRFWILLLEDSLLDAELIGARLSRGGIDFAMDRVDTRDDYVSALETGRYDLILADYSLPSFDGLSALEIAREGWPHLPFVFVSGGLGEEVAIDSLKRGATDYLLKGKLDRLGPVVTRAIAEARERAERRRTEAALRESEERHRLILETVKDYAIITLDTDGRVSGWNRGAEQLLGFPEAEILGRPIRLIFSPDDVRARVPQGELGQAAGQGRGGVAARPRPRGRGPGRTRARARFAARTGPTVALRSP